MVKGRIVYEIEGFPAYRISKEGIVTNIAYPNQYMEIKSRVDRGGYEALRLTDNGITHTKFVHRLIAQTFLVPIEGKQFVNHINGNKLDNRIENLEWVSHAENIEHAYKNGLCKKNCIMIQDNTSGKIYQSIKEAAIYTSIPYSSLKNMLCGRRTNRSNLVYSS